MGKTLANHVGRETVIGRWKLSRLTRAVTREFEQWAATQLESPLRAARAEVEQLARCAAEVKADATLDDATKEEILEANRRQQEQITAACLDRSSLPLSVRSSALLGTPEGSTRMLYLLLRKHQPDVTEDDAFDLLIEQGLDSVQQKIDEAAGQSPEKNSAPPAATT